MLRRACTPTTCRLYSSIAASPAAFILSCPVTVCMKIHASLMLAALVACAPPPQSIATPLAAPNPTAGKSSPERDAMRRAAGGEPARAEMVRAAGGEPNRAEMVRMAGGTP